MAIWPMNLTSAPGQFAVTIETVKGGHGGVRVAEWFHLDRRMLNAEEIALLHRLGESLDGHDREIINRIVAAFSH